MCPPFVQHHPQVLSHRVDVERRFDIVGTAQAYHDGLSFCLQHARATGESMNSGSSQSGYFPR